MIIVELLMHREFFFKHFFYLFFYKFTIIDLLFLLIPVSTINGRIDQVNQLLELDHQKRNGARYMALDKWTNQLNTLNQAIVSKLA